MKRKVVYESEVGEYLDNDPWRIVKNEDALLRGMNLCKHCKITKYDEKGGATEGIIPYVIEASAECGYVGTQVCLECVLEACSKLGIDI